ncbi:hypothetical protein ACWEPC_54440, partial [Nonomuraea sp. NPDC004297]
MSEHRPTSGPARATAAGQPEQAHEGERPEQADRAGLPEQAHGGERPAQAGGGGYPTALGASTRESITLLGHDLAADVMGEVGFGELAF